ncbi:hypothetical protein F0562_010196 [Nyssa sinensis]|uniref:Terpene synthase metal-binding domain-containing protein n=1 Tax=Nyssa sinensis TaxID=561372 RepID=A0A5J4ZY61_9ASTE|nr:hypothetical protein F0562_010196 [Nyssa sinensis]
MIRGIISGRENEWSTDQRQSFYVGRVELFQFVAIAWLELNPGVTLCQHYKGYIREVNWYYKGYMPTFEEYLSVSVMSSGYPMLAVQSLISMADIATKEAFDWVITVPNIVRSCALIARLVDDIQTHKVPYMNA